MAECQRSILDFFKNKVVFGSEQPVSCPIEDVEPPKLHALIIGINSYPNIVPQLKGAVRDAEVVVDYLANNLNVDQSQICTLLDDQATRSAIIEAIKNLGTDPRIQKGDAIVIFYAGHGAKLERPKGWEHGEPFIQALVPYDIKFNGPDGQPICAIPDRTIATLLNDIAEQKGDNITVILDCCHSASGTRMDSQGRIARFVHPDDLPPLTIEVDQDILSRNSVQRDIVVAKGFAYQELRSHVLLAACGSKEFAYETDGMGDFTAALIKTLKKFGADKTTYMGCIHRLPILQKQNPQCEGWNKERIFFNAKVPGANRKFIQIKKQDEKCYLSAGIAQGITVGAEFEVYTDHIMNHANNPPLGTMRVTHVEPMSSTLDWANDDKPFELCDLAYGYQVMSGSDQSLRVHFTDSLQSRLTLDDEWYPAFQASRTTVVLELCDKDMADVVVDLDRDMQAVFDIRHEFLGRYGVKELPKSVPTTAEDILAVLRAAALWIWHLNRSNPDSSLEQSVRLEFTRVRKNPQTRVLEAGGEDLNISGPVEITACPFDLYGMRIVNKTPYDLYPYLFYFDVNGLSIETWNGQAVGNAGVDAPLPKCKKDEPGSFLTLGYGSGGCIPFAFEVDPKVLQEVGILKLYVTNKPAEFSSIEHPSPFTFDQFGKRVSLSATEVGKTLAMRAVWHTVSLTLIQKRPTEGLTWFS